MRSRPRSHSHSDTLPSLAFLFVTLAALAPPHSSHLLCCRPCWHKLDPPPSVVRRSPRRRSLCLPLTQKPPSVASCVYTAAFCFTFPCSLREDQSAARCGDRLFTEGFGHPTPTCLQHFMTLLAELLYWSLSRSCFSPLFPSSVSASRVFTFLYSSSPLHTKNIYFEHINMPNVSLQHLTAPGTTPLGESPSWNCNHYWHCT